MRVWLSCLALAVSAATSADNFAHNHANNESNKAPHKHANKDLAQQLWQAKQQQGRWPDLLGQHALAANKAYQVQADYNRLANSGAQVSGFKAGLTTLGSWHKFGLTEPLSGVLFAKQRLAKAEYRLKPGLKFEAEFAFRLKDNVDKVPQDIAALKQLVDAVAPAVELPSLAFSARPKGVDVIGVNAAAYKYYIGTWQPVAKAGDLTALTVSVSCKGQVLQQAKGDSVYGDPWAAALWLVQQQMSLGHQLRAGQVLLTGAIGKMLTPEVCDYDLDFQQLGRIELKLS